MDVLCYTNVYSLREPIVHGLYPGGGKLLGIRFGGVPPGSPNPEPISDQNMLFSIPVFRPDMYVYKGLIYVTIA